MRYECLVLMYDIFDHSFDATMTLWNLVVIVEHIRQIFNGLLACYNNTSLWLNYNTFHSAAYRVKHLPTTRLD